jgi:hypothetical protein
MNYKRQYNTQKSSAKGRNIPWHFTYESWLAWWDSDISNRGRGAGQLVMARYGDVGPYQSDNVFKCLFEDNVRAVDRSLSNDKRSKTLSGRTVATSTKAKMAHNAKISMTADKKIKMAAARWPDNKLKESI